MENSSHVAHPMSIWCPTNVDSLLMFIHFILASLVGPHLASLAYGWIMAIGMLVTGYNLVSDDNRWTREQLGPKCCLVTSRPMAISLRNFLCHFEESNLDLTCILTECFQFGVYIPQHTM